VVASGITVNTQVSERFDGTIASASRVAGTFEYKWIETAVVNGQNVSITEDDTGDWTGTWTSGASPTAPQTVPVPQH
jgi:hypothetical protein